VAELTQKERLQPSLLDRLTDDFPLERLESREQRVLGLNKLRECVVRDLEWLLNTENSENIFEAEDYPEVQRSTFNFGIPVTAGLPVTGIESRRLEERVRAAIEMFEPRIIASTLGVRGVYTSDLMSRKTVVFEISGEMWAQPIPLKLYLRTELDLETGKVVVAESKR
jgi:type VI secretion system protein ImpF